MGVHVVGGIGIKLDKINKCRLSEGKIGSLAYNISLLEKVLLLTNSHSHGRQASEHRANFIKQTFQMSS